MYYTVTAEIKEVEMMSNRQYTAFIQHISSLDRNFGFVSNITEYF